MLRVLAVTALSALSFGVAAQGTTTPPIKGTAHSDSMRGTPTDDLMYGLGGNDDIDGRGGFDVIFGGLGDDKLSGDGGKDYLSGQEGDDTLFAAYVDGGLVDFVSCGTGDDLVVIAGVPEAGRGAVRRLLDGTPSQCESVRFTR